MLARTLLARNDRTVITATPATSVEEAMECLIENNISCLPVVDGADLVGMISDKDIFRKIHETKGEYRHLRVADLMTTELIIGLPDDDVNFIAGLMDRNSIRHVPIIEGQGIIGLISLSDINRLQTEHAEIENRYLKLYTGGLGVRDKSSDF